MSLKCHDSDASYGFSSKAMKIYFQVADVRLMACIELLHSSHHLILNNGPITLKKEQWEPSGRGALSSVIDQTTPYTSSTKMA